MHVGVGYCDHPDSYSAGKNAAAQALEKAGRTDPCDLVLLFATARHDQESLREAVASITGNEKHIYGGGASGVITNDTFGYAGDQVGVACIWMDGSRFDAVVEEHLEQGEEQTGERLGKRLAELGTTPDSPVMLFYDAIDRTHGDVRLLMATWLLEGLQKGLGFFPDLNGAGVQGDHICTPTQQYIGEGMTDHTALALKFSDDIRIDSVIMHGCRPASPYFTVTKAEGPVILEINGRNAIEFMDELLAPNITPEQYPFFLLFGINHGDRWAEYDENNYASRLCLGIDKERGGIVMFEPDMVAGTEFQLMYRSLDLTYMKPKIEQAFEQLEGRTPVFAMYIDCAGRCAGYGGVDIEDAVVLQKAINNRVPLLGLYTGVEISHIGGRPRGLDWTGVFCIFSKAEPGEKSARQRRDDTGWKNKSHEDKSEMPLNVAYSMIEEGTAKIFELDTQSIAIRQELEQKRRGFSLLSELAVSLRQGSDESIFLPVTQRINAALNMQRTIVLLPDGHGKFIPSVLQGYSPEEKMLLAGQRIEVDDELLDPENSILVNADDSDERFAALRKTLMLPYFISSPVLVRNEVAAILLTGRMMEAMPYLSRLGHTDVETVQAITALLSSVWVYRRLDDATKRAQTDTLTGLLNRGALELQAAELLEKGSPGGKMSAFLVIDFDHFKSVNDTHGHMEGDIALKALAQTLHQHFRSTDLVSRIGGDEFAVFCPRINNARQIRQRLDQLMDSWRSLPLMTKSGVSLSATLSVGIALAPRDGNTYDELFRKADIALYTSKKNGRNQYTIYDTSMGDTTPEQN